MMKTEYDTDAAAQHTDEQPWHKIAVKLLGSTVESRPTSHANALYGDRPVRTRSGPRKRQKQHSNPFDLLSPAGRRSLARLAANSPDLAVPRSDHYQIPEW
jgi:hypothetical protein